MVFFTYADRPGIIGKVGTIFGEHGVNIATMDVGRRAEGGDALMCLTVDSEVPIEVLRAGGTSDRCAPAAHRHPACVAGLPDLRSFRNGGRPRVTLARS